MMVYKISCSFCISDCTKEESPLVHYRRTIHNLQKKCHYRDLVIRRLKTRLSAMIPPPVVEESMSTIGDRLIELIESQDVLFETINGKKQLSITSGLLVGDLVSTCGVLFHSIVTLAQNSSDDISKRGDTCDSVVCCEV